jgi:hypothetical protein
MKAEDKERNKGFSTRFKDNQFIPALQGVNSPKKQERNRIHPTSTRLQPND